MNWLEDMVGLDYAPAAFWGILALVALLVLYGIIRLIRRLRSGTYVAGGRNRKARLSIMDAAAVDTHRRLVLVRRDDVEHLLLIGGNSDIVVERDIRLSGPVRRSAPTMEPVVEEPSPAPAPRPVTHAPAPRPVTTPTRPVTTPVAPPLATARPQPAPAPRAPSVAPAPRPVATPTRYTPPVKSKDEIDDDLMKELESALDIDETPPPAPAPQEPLSLDDEMAKLLGELTSHKR